MKQALNRLLYFGIKPFYQPDRVKFARLFYGLVLLFIAYRVYAHLLLSQLQQPQLIYVGLDVTYIAFAVSGITRFVAQHHAFAVAFDLAFVLSALACFLYPRNNRWSILFAVLLACYLVISYSFLCFHKHNLTGMWFASLLFVLPDKNGFNLLFKLIRYYAVLVYASAGFWKFYRGVWCDGGHFPVIIKNDALPYLTENPGTWLAVLISWLIAHPALLDNIMTATCFIQLLCIAGLFTRRFDGWILLFAITFHAFSLLFLKAWFLEFSLILLTLLPVHYFYRRKIA